MGATWSELFPPTPNFTEKDLPQQSGRVFIVTGGYSGVGLELCKILYLAGGKVYVAGRSEEKALDAIQSITQAASETPELDEADVGVLEFLSVDLSDLETIKPAVQQFLSKESRLDVLFNNAGVSLPPKGSVSAQGHELQLATNCLGPYLLTQLLLPTMVQTAQSTDPQLSAFVTRVVWLSSIVIAQTPTGGIDTSRIGVPFDMQEKNYARSKLGNWMLAASHNRAVGGSESGILHVAANPGNIKTSLLRHMSAFVPYLVAPLLYPPKMGAYTELWAGLSPELTGEHGGGYVLPWGRLNASPRSDLLTAVGPRQGDKGGTADEFQAFCEEKTREYK